MKLLFLSILVLFFMNITTINPTKAASESSENTDYIEWYLEANLVGNDFLQVCCCAGGEQYTCNGEGVQITCTPGGIWNCESSYSELTPDPNYDCDRCCPDGGCA